MVYLRAAVVLPTTSQEDPHRLDEAAALWRGIRGSNKSNDDIR